MRYSTIKPVTSQPVTTRKTVNRVGSFWLMAGVASGFALLLLGTLFLYPKTAHGYEECGTPTISALPPWFQEYLDLTAESGISEPLPLYDGPGLYQLVVTLELNDYDRAIRQLEERLAYLELAQQKRFTVNDGHFDVPHTLTLSSFLKAAKGDLMGVEADFEYFLRVGPVVNLEDHVEQLKIMVVAAQENPGLYFSRAKEMVRRAWLARKMGHSDQKADPHQHHHH